MGKLSTKVWALIIAVVIIASIAGYIGYTTYLGLQKPVSEKKTIKIACLLSLSGGAAYANQHSLAGIEVKVDEINKGGGIYVSEFGRKLPIELIVYNDEGDPSKAATLLRKAVEEDRADFIFYAYGSKMYNTYAELLEKYRGSVLGLGTAANTNSAYNYSFSFFPSTINYKKVIFDFLESLPKELRPTKFAIIDNVIWKPTTEAWQIPYIKEKFGEVVYVAYYTEGKVEDFTPYIQAAVAAGADALISTSNVPSGPLIAPALKASGLMSKFKFICIQALGIYAAKCYEVGGKEIYEGIFADGYPTEDIPEVKRIADLVRSKLGLKLGEFVEWGGICYYKMVEILANAIEKVGSLDKEKIRNYLLSLDYFDPVLGRVKFFRDRYWLEKCQVMWQQLSESSLVLVQQQKGVLKVVWPPQMKTGDAIYPYPYGKG